MKLKKVAFLFFCIWCLVQMVSCTKKNIPNTSDKIALDSISFFIEKIKNANLQDSTRLHYANDAILYSEKLNITSNFPIIFDYKIYLLGNIKWYDSAVYTTRKLIKLGKEKNDSTLLGKNYPKIAYYFKLNKQKDSAFKYYNLTKNEYLKYNDSISNGRYLLDLAILQSDFGDYNGSDETSILALKYFNNKDSLNSSSVYNCMAISSKKRKEFELAIKYYDKAIDLTTSKLSKIIYLNNKANALRYLKYYDKSISLFRELLKDSIVNSMQNTKARILDNLAYTKWLSGDNENVLSGLNKALTIRIQENDLYGSIASYAHLSDYYKNKNTRISISFATKMLQSATIQNSPQDKIEALQKLISLDNFVKTKKYYNAYIHINDSLQDAKLKSKNKYAKIKYESEKNQKENLQLKIGQSRIKLDLEKEKFRGVIGAVSSGSIVVGLLILVYYRKQKHKLEKREEVYKTETRIAKKIHDEVANNVVNIMNKVQYTKETKDGLLDDLEKVYLLTRDISHQNNSIETGDKFEGSLKTLLTSYNSKKTTIILKDINDVGLIKISKGKQIEVYRILQELMVNMQKHSEASLVVILFENNDNQYLINYSDNGIGFDFDSSFIKNGLKNVETRMKSINGIINFETSLNNGFKAFISFKK